MTRKYLETNCYGLSPQIAETIACSIRGTELEGLNVELESHVGFIDGSVDEYDKTYPIHDTIKVIVKGELLGKLVINSTELALVPQYNIPKEDFIQVSFITMGNHPLIPHFLDKQLPIAENVVGEKAYNFLVIHKLDLIHAKDTILNKLKVKIEKAYSKVEVDSYINSIREKYITLI